MVTRTPGEPCARLTERKIEARGIRCSTCPTHVPPFSQSPREPCLSLFKECPEPWPWGFSPTPGPLTEAGATFPWVFIYSLAGPRPPGKSACHVFGGGIRSQELSGQSSSRLWCPARPKADRVEVGGGPRPSLCQSFLCQSWRLGEGAQSQLPWEAQERPQPQPEPLQVTGSPY